MTAPNPLPTDLAPGEKRMRTSMTDMLVKRFESYFMHPDWEHDVLGPGDRAIACYNIRQALRLLEVGSDLLSSDEEIYDNKLKKEEIYDNKLKEAVRELQELHQHRPADGLVGSGTRQLLVSELLRQFRPTIFRRGFRRPEGRQQPSVFLSYAWRDGPKVDKLDQWLRDHGVAVLRDRDYFVAGLTIEENIARALSVADKIIAVLSKESRSRDWPQLERSLAEQVEAKLGSSVLIYLRLDDTPLPAYDSTRLAISAGGLSLKEVGEQLLHAITGAQRIPPHYHYDESEPL